MKNYSDNSPEDSLTGFSFEMYGKQKKNKSDLSAEELSELFGQMEFVYIESINTFISELIGKITDGIIDIEYDKTRFSRSKRELKDAYDKYVEGLSAILGTFANNVTLQFPHHQTSTDIHFPNTTKPPNKPY